MLRNHAWVVLWANIAQRLPKEFCCKTICPAKRLLFRGFITASNTSGWYTLALIFTPFLQKWIPVTSLWLTPHYTTSEVGLCPLWTLGLIFLVSVDVLSFCRLNFPFKVNIFSSVLTFFHLYSSLHKIFYFRSGFR